MDGARRQDSLGVSSSVAEGVLTPAALHLRVSAEVEREGEVGGVNGPRCHRLHFRPLIESPPQTAMPTHIFTATKYYPDRGALGSEQLCTQKAGDHSVEKPPANWQKCCPPLQQQQQGSGHGSKHPTCPKLAAK
ncbi:eEF1A lysine and N-terminal methyltransferase [Dissostichus eleginoides]|uniref:EEF1A lysine and N-terminal methyltransferase n=1 Tax=Dissostichus eleginoides TaxID=100907 RepID=A0AAD9CJQ6_DISEL|nr:eEF1A lysine and N-terminal methyltransferase [Dissostichus eleginoides]